MDSWMYHAKRWISYILIYALLCGALGSYSMNHVSASTRQSLRQAGTSYLSESSVSTQSGIIIDGRKVQIQVSGLEFSVIDPEQAGNAGSEDVPGEPGLVATGAGLELLYGISENFAIQSQGVPVLFRFSSSKPLGNCRQFRAITTAAQGVDVWLLDASLNPVSVVQGLGGTKVWRTCLKDYTTYYILVCGAAGTTGKFMCSDVIDDYGGDFSTAGNIYFNQDYSIETEISGDVDMLAFRASAAVSTYQLRIDSVVGSGGTYEVYDQNKRKIAKYSGTMNKATITLPFVPSPGARYYFRFTSGQTGRKILFRVAQATTQYRIVYHLNGGKNAKGNPSYYISTTPKFALQKATRSKYLFYGWYADPSFRTRVQYVQGQTRKNLHLYAKWEKVSPKATSIKSVKSKKIKQATVKWDKATGVRGYHLVYGTSRSLKKSVKKKDTKKTSLTLKGLKPGKTYYFKVCTYSLDSKGKKVYSKYSKVKKVKIKEKKKTKKKTKKKSATKKKTTTTKKTTTKKAATKKTVKKKKTT